MFFVGLKEKMRCFLFVSFVGFLCLDLRFDSFGLRFVESSFNFQQNLFPIFKIFRFSLI